MATDIVWFLTVESNLNFFDKNHLDMHTHFIYHYIQFAKGS